MDGIPRSATPRITRIPEVALDAASLERELRAALEGEVRFDAGSKALYATDASNYRQIPIGVVLPRTVEDVLHTVEICRQHGAPIVSRGGGTSLAGQTCNVAVVLDFSKYLNRILALDPQARRAKVEPGIILDHLRNAAEAHHLTFGPDPATHSRCTIGGMIGNDSCGMHAQMAGRTSQNIAELEILTYRGHRMRVKNRYSEAEIEAIVRQGGEDGRIFQALRELRDRYAERIRARFPEIPRLVSGYGLQFLLPENGFNVAGALVGSESTCVTVLEATTCLVESPPSRVLVMLGYPDIYQAGDHVAEILAFQPIALEGIDDRLLDIMHAKGLYPHAREIFPEGKGWLAVELGGSDRAEADRQAQALMDALGKAPHPPSMKLMDRPEEERVFWEIREAGLAATASVPREGDFWPGWEDSAVPPDRVGDYLRDLRGLFEKYGYRPSVYGHWGQGCIHCSIDFDLVTAEGIGKFRAFVQEAAETVVKYGGSLSGEHGDGQARGELLPLMFGDDLVQAFREFKAIWDPDWKMNPGKVVDPYPITSNLRLGSDCQPPELKTHFQFPEENGSFAHATLRCVGVGKCRRMEGGTMCPSFMVTREEAHTTRGRAHALFEMLQGDVLEGGWKDPHVKETLDLCLSCKGCKTECPVNVDMATYKAEFLAHYYQGRLRPRSAYAMGLITFWARLASLAPGVANTMMRTPGLSRAMKWIGGIAPERDFPTFAPRTFKAWFRERAPRNPGAEDVILWVDTFNNHFTPHIAQAAVEALEHAGFHVQVPEDSLCCGRPLYDFGMLDLAKKLLRDVLGSLKPQIEAGIPVVGLEPSCVSVFRDEMINLFPHDQDAKRLHDQVFLFSEFLERKAPDVEYPPLHRKAILHGHCHQKSVLGDMQNERRILERLGLDVTTLDSGCCGMAGSFGFEAGHYEISNKIGERVLLPAVREADRETLVITDGFSCREQVQQGSGREALHLAEVIQLSLHQGERPREEARSARPSVMPWIVAGILVVGGIAAISQARRR